MSQLFEELDDCVTRVDARWCNPLTDRPVTQTVYLARNDGGAGA
ncbi:hypothetical protein [Alkalilacustris brevis]|nr:hypothetical protein [Alkalilacustris brevis]